MGGLGCGCAVTAALFAALATIPLLGWMNWLTTLPVAAMAIVFGILGITTKQQPTAGALAIAAGILILFWALFRLALGGGLL